jgi:hypothetical protein
MGKAKTLLDGVLVLAGYRRGQGDHAFFDAGGQPRDEGAGGVTEGAARDRLQRGGAPISAKLWIEAARQPLQRIALGPRHWPKRIFVD